MKAVVLTAYGDVDKLELRDLPDPHADPGAIVVRMAGAGINRVDWEIRSGSARGRHPVELPAVLGIDASGVVVEVGQGVTTFSVGDHVLGTVTGAYEELIAAPASAWAKIPPGLLDAIADTVDGETLKKLYGKLKPGGVLGTVLGELAGAGERGIVVHAFRSKPDAAMLARYAAFVANRKLVIPIAKKMPLAAAREAQSLAERGHPRGKVLLVA